MLTPLVPAPSSNFDTQQRWHGRLYAPDVRDLNYPMELAIRAMSRAELKRRTQSPARGPTLNQLATPRCVMYSAATSLGAAPLQYGRTAETVLAVVQQQVGEPPGFASNQTYRDLYEWAQAHDEWPGENYEGTSVRAGQEYLKLIGRSSGYVWARNIDEAKDYISRVGSAPIILGIDWHEGMDDPIARSSAYYIEPKGDVVGGHAICCLWFDKRKKAWKLQNTWGEDWGDKGIVYLPDEYFDYLVFQTNGEAASFTENPL